MRLAQRLHLAFKLSGTHGLVTRAAQQGPKDR